MRGTGKTTRLIDEAIQILFEYGEVTIPVDSESESFQNRTPVETMVWGAEDFNETSQVELFEKLLTRLTHEHPGQFTVEDFTIRLDV